MFDKSNLSNVGGLSQAQALFTYNTSDSDTNVVSSGYFDEARGTLNDDGYIIVKGDRDYILRVSSASIPIQSEIICDLAGQMPYASFQYVSSLSQLPSPSAGVITLDAEKTYFFCGDIDLLGSRIVCGQDTVILGASSENASITSTGLSASEYMVYTQYTLPIRHITFKSGGF